MQNKLPKNATKVFSGVIYDVYQWRQKLYDGTYTTFEKLVRGDIVNIIPITLEGKIITTKQSQPSHQDFFGMPGGKVDPGESGFEAAKRELLEETGYQAKSWHLWRKKQFLSNIVCDTYVYIATGCKKVSSQNLDAGEKIELDLLNFQEWLNLLVDDQFRDFEISLEIFKLKQNQRKWHKFLELLNTLSDIDFYEIDTAKI